MVLLQQAAMLQLGGGAVKGKARGELRHLGWGPDSFNANHTNTALFLYNQAKPSRFTNKGTEVQTSWQGHTTSEGQKKAWAIRVG